MNGNKSFFVWLGVALVIVLIIAGGLYFAAPSTSVPGTGVGGALSVPVSADDSIFGSETAKVTLVEYSDFECPACAAYFPLVEQLVREFPNDVRLVYRHFPLPQHPLAIPAAAATEAARNQGKFWEMYRLIFDNQSAWENRKNAPEIFRGYAKQLGLNLTKFDADLDSSAVSQRIADQKNGGIASGVNATPTFYLNGEKIVNPNSYEQFTGLIQAALEAK